MTDYISRDALLKELMLDPIGRMLIKRYNLDGFIKAQPTVEAVPVVRCKDCKHNNSKSTSFVACVLVGEMYGRKADNYCSLAEVKEE